MLSFIQKFWKDESGQDLIEYTLLMAFVALASAALFIAVPPAAPILIADIANRSIVAAGRQSTIGALGCKYTTRIWTGQPQS